MARVYGTGTTSTDVAKTSSAAFTGNGASQVLAAANKDRQSLFVSNNDATNPTFLSLGSAASANSGIRIGAGQTIELKGYTGVVNFFAAAAVVVSIAEV